MIKYQSSALFSFPNYQFHLLHYITFVEQKVMIHLGDCQVIFFPPPLLMLSHSLFHSLSSSVSCPLSFSTLSSSSVAPFWNLFLKVARGDKTAMPTGRESQTHELSAAGGQRDWQMFYWLLYGCHRASKRARKVKRLCTLWLLAVYFTLLFNFGYQSILLRAAKCQTDPAGGGTVYIRWLVVPAWFMVWCYGKSKDQIQ